MRRKRAPAPDRDRVERLAQEGRDVEAVDLLASINAHDPQPDSELRLQELRARAAAGYAPGGGKTPWPPTYADPFPHLDAVIPEIHSDQLTTDMLAGTVAHHGCLLVRGVLSPTDAAGLVDMIERAHQAREQISTQPEPADDALTAWFRPLPGSTKPMTNAQRQRVVEGGGIWLADSPTATARVIDGLAGTNVVESVSGHFGERPFFSLQKSTLRRVAPVHQFTSWHQDGSFLDPDVRTMNLWLALSDCGGELASPGLEVVPKRIPDILPVDNVMANYAVSFDTVREVAADAPTVVPEFAAGDALMFDERFLHRTHLTKQMNRARYALECWMFAPSHQSPNYTPLLI